MPNAIEMLREDHRKVQELFEQFEQGDEESKGEICQQTLQELEIHAAVEEEIFYPAAREEVDEEDTIDEALEEHHVAKLLLAELKKMSPGDERFDAKYKVLTESVKHHIEEEESELFPSVEGQLDLEQIGQQMEARKQKLQQRFSSGSQSRGRKTKSRASTGTRRGKKTGAGKKRKRASGGRR